jgi:protein involved in polysaccharide export with SLBB domain
VIRLTIWREPDLSRELTVPPGGVVVFPKIGARTVTGRPLSNVEAELLRSDFSTYLINPSIQVELLRKVQVLGAVYRPGVYTVDATVFVSDAIAIAGGVTPSGRQDRVELRRDGEVVQVLFMTRAALADAPIRSGDQLFVPSGLPRPQRRRRRGGPVRWDRATRRPAGTMIMINENGRGASAKGERRLGLAEIASAARRRPLLAAGLPTVLLASTGFFLWWAEPTYDAAATVRVDQDRSGVAIIEALQTLSSGSKISTEMEELRSRSLAEEVVDSLSLQVTVVRPRKVARSALFTSIAAARTAPPGRYTIRPVGDGRFSVSDGMRDWTVRAGESMHVPGLRFTLAPAAASHDRIVLDVEPFQEAVRDYLRAASVSRPNREADIIRIRYEGRDRDIVRDVPNIAAQRFIERRNRVRTREARSTAEFLEWQIARSQRSSARLRTSCATTASNSASSRIEAEGEAQVSRLADMQAEREMLGVERNALLR